MNKIITIIIALFTVSSSMLFAETLEETFKKRIVLGDKTGLSVHGVNGSVAVSGWNQDEIEIIAYKKVKASSHQEAKEVMEKLRIDISEVGQEIKVKIFHPKRSGGEGGFFSWIFGGDHGNVSVKFEISVPRKLNLDLHSTNGSIIVDGCEGKHSFNTTNGKIRAEDISGALSAKSTNGSIYATLNEAYADEDMTLKTTNGSIKLHLPQEIDADLEARTTNGSIQCDLSLKGDVYQTKRKLEGQINKGGPLLYLKTTNGSVRIYEN